MWTMIMFVVTFFIAIFSFGTAMTYWEVYSQDKWRSLLATFVVSPEELDVKRNEEVKEQVRQDKRIAIRYSLISMVAAIACNVIALFYL